ncbi:MAG: YncE family protein [Candidatus Sericytochromatia bacterium]
MQRLTVMTLSFFAAVALAACQNTSAPTQPNPTPSASSMPAVLTIPVGKAPHGMSQAAGFVYNSNSGDNTISVIDTRTDSVVKTITLAEGAPNYVKASHNGKYIVVANTDAGKVHIFDPAQDHALLHTVDVGPGPDKLQISADDSWVFVTLTGDKNVVGMDFCQGWTTAPRLQRWEAGAPAADGGGHRSLDAQGDWLLLPNPGDNDVSLLNRVTGEHKRLRDGNTPGPVGLGMTNGQVTKAIVGNTASHTLTVFDIASGTHTTLDKAGQGPTDMAVVPELGRAFVTMAGSNQVAVVDYVNNKLLGTVPTGQRPVHIYVAPEAEMHTAHEGHDHGPSAEIWVGNDTGDTVTVFDAATLEVKATHALGKGHHKMAFTPEKAYVSNITDGTISVIARHSHE